VIPLTITHYPPQPVGWTCPRCGRVYSPDTGQCFLCNLDPKPPAAKEAIDALPKRQELIDELQRMPREIGLTARAIGVIHEAEEGAFAYAMRRGPRELLRLRNCGHATQSLIMRGIDSWRRRRSVAP
jgi:hypothetical protein